MKATWNIKMVRLILIGVLLFFGLLTLFLSSSILLDLFDMREKEGNYVQFVVLANFFASVFYLVAAFGLIVRKPWARFPLWMASVLLIGTSLAFAWYVYQGGIYEQHTSMALIFRSLLTLAFYFTAAWIGRTQQQQLNKTTLRT